MAAKPELMELNPGWVLFEDQHLLVLSKPSNLLSQADHTGDPSVVSLLQTYLGRPYVGLVHRLDRMTSGLMVIAKRSKSADRLSQQLRTGQLRRVYWAALTGNLPEATQTWRHWLRKDNRTNQVQSVKPGTPDAQEAVLHVTRLETLTAHAASAARFELETGRSHQIRVQSAAVGHALLGDPKYGRAGVPGRPALHSWQMQLLHPISKEEMRFEAPLPEDLKRLLNPSK